VSWSERPLGEVAQHELGKMLDKAKNKGDLKSYLANVNVRWGEFDLTNLREMRFSDHELDRFSVRCGDIVMCEGGEPGRCALWKDESAEIMFQKALHRIRPRDGMDSLFLYYALLDIGHRNGFAPFFTGATIKHLPREQLARIPIRFPDIRRQKTIASSLERYDDLIAINRRRMALLEEAARRLYREWFVHLRFPGYEAVKLIDGVPDGWRMLPLTSVANFINGYAFKPAHLQDTGLPVVKIPELRDGITAKTPYSQASAVPQRNHIDTGDVLFSWSATLLVNEWAEGPALLNQHLFKVVPHNELHRRLVRFGVEVAIPHLLGHSVGATMQHIRRSALDAYMMLVPDIAVGEAFAERVGPMMDSVINLKAQVRALTKARDDLLPKLMSGQLDVSGIQLPEQQAA